MSHAAPARPLTSHRAKALSGRVSLPGDKSISHRALIFGALATGRTQITGLLEVEDVLSTARALRALGAPIRKVGDTWEVLGRGVSGLQQPDVALDFGNSGTGARLMMGVVAGQPITVKMTGDASLSRRPMGRVLQPLQQMGLQLPEGGTDTLPITIRGSAELLPLSYELPVASAQLKTAILIAGLAAAGETTVSGEETRDHTERMLAFFGAGIRTTRHGNRATITVTGEAELSGRQLVVPGDPSSAAFLAAAALIVPGSDIAIDGVLINPMRRGFYDTLAEMGADITFENERSEGGEPVADLRVRASRLKGVRVPLERAPSMIDEYPILSVLAAFADGETRMEGLAELKVKESDRLAATAAGLAVNGVQARIDGDTLIVGGAGPRSVKGGGRVVTVTHMDHRIAMAFLVMGLASDAPVTVDDASFISTSFQEFRSLMERLGARFS